MNDDKTSQIIRFRNGGKKYVAEFIGSDFVSPKHQGTFIHAIAMFRIYNENKTEVLGCVTFTRSLLSDFLWAEPTKKHFPEQYRDETLVNLLHYLPFYPAKLKQLYSDCYEYRFERGLEKDQEEDCLYKIETETNYQTTFQRIIFGEVTNKKIQDAALEIMYNHWEDNPDTNIPVGLLETALQIRKVTLDKNLKLLLEEDKIRAVTDPNDQTILISVGLRSGTIRQLEGEVEPGVRYPQMVKQVFGTNIENLTTHGANSPINISIGDIDTAFGNITKQIEEKEFNEKQEVLGLVQQLQNELRNKKEPEKIKSLTDKIKEKAAWVYNLIMANPILTAYITQLLLQTITQKLPTT